MYKHVDARGQSCPLPVINTKKALDALDAGWVITLVDNEAARDNLIKLAEGLNCEVRVEAQGSEFQVEIKKGTVADLPTHLDQERANLGYFITGETLGRGSEELGAVLIKSFFYTVTQSEHLPRYIAFLNGGVHLPCEESPVLGHLMELEKMGVEILTCGTCLDYYQKKNKLCVGSVSNMYTILEKLTACDKVISL